MYPATRENQPEWFIVLGGTSDVGQYGIKVGVSILQSEHIGIDKHPACKIMRIPGPCFMLAS